MITFGDKLKKVEVKPLEPTIFRTETNKKKERHLVWIKDRPITRENESVDDARGRVTREKEDEITGTKGFKCVLCGMIHRTKTQPKICECEKTPPKAEIEIRGGRKISVKSVWCVCPASHGFWNPLSYPDTGCKKCKQLENALTPSQIKVQDKRNLELKIESDKAKKMLREREKYKLMKEYKLKCQEWEIQAKMIATEIQKLGEKNVQQK